MNISTVFGSIRRNLQNHGLRSVAHDIALRALNALPSHLEFTCLKRKIFSRSLKPGENELDIKFVNKALHKGDECYAILDGGRLANYGWYSRRPTLSTTTAYSWSSSVHLRVQRIHA